MYYVQDGFYGIDVVEEYSVPDQFCDRKSFYGKAKIVVTADGMYLRSYETLVCYLSNDGKFQKLWNDYSATTMRHINAFMKYIGKCSGGKAWWDALEYRKEYDIKYL